MDTAQFLARVIPAGNYVTIQYKTTKGFWVVRSYPAAEGITDAAGELLWAAGKGMDAYHAHAAFTAAEVITSKTGKQHVVAKREQANVHVLKTLVIDADVKREGDNKNPDKVFVDRKAAATWLAEFTAKASIPPPNLAVNSGYGYHWYWLLETPLTLADWNPLAQALRAAMHEHGWIGDTSPTVDGARLLRPPGTVNLKSGTPVPVTVIEKLTGSDYPNNEIVQALTPWINALPHLERATGTHGGATVHSLGPRPAHIPPGPGPDIGANAHAGVQPREYLYKAILGKCAQAQLSHSTQGAGLDYPKWYRGDLTLLEFCVDGANYRHEVSKAHEDYTYEKTEEAAARIHKERLDKTHLGAPHCRSFDEYQPGVCRTCPFWTKILSPIALGADDGDLPYGYRRVGTGVLARIERAAKEDGKQVWQPLIGGNIDSPRLDRLHTRGHQITFIYDLAGDRSPITIKGSDVGNPLSLLSIVERQGLSPDRHNIGHIGDFAVAWINKLREQRAAHNDTSAPFGWSFSASGERLGLAIAGTLYRCDGGEDYISGGDPNVVSMYTPSGSFEEWKRVAALFEGKRADLQTLIATAFAAPLVALCSDVRGMSWNFWSTESGVGKSSALKLAQSVWGEFRGAQSMDDTPYSVMKTMAELRVLPKNWDELKVQKSWNEAFVRLIYTIPQGKDRTRLMSDTSLREVGGWETYLVFTSNRSMQTYLVHDNSGTDSGLTRLLEIHLPKVQIPYDPVAAQLLKLMETNYGYAGRKYAKWLAANAGWVKQKLGEVLAQLTTDLGAQQEERFFTTAMACAIVGASIAKKLDIFDFDVAGIHATLTKAFLAARASRSDQTVVSASGGYDLEEVFGEFVYQMADYRLRTSEFAHKGKNKVDTLHEPRAGTNKVIIHIAEANATMRVVRAELSTWLHNKNLPANTIIDQMVSQWSASPKRRTLGGGTKFIGGQIWTLDIPLVGNLASFLAPVKEKDADDKGDRKQQRKPGNEATL